MSKILHAFFALGELREQTLELFELGTLGVYNRLGRLGEEPLVRQLGADTGFFVTI